ncbi:MAG: glycosyltransferase family 2 protein [Candidatus Tantalella remota]|nr:glycosyltransferase family 2 protein [Candidatus Tantalella remota]
MGISIAIIALNEEKNLPGCIDAVSWADEVVVVDGGSVDATTDIAGDKGANIFERKFDDFEKQKNYALSKAKEDWVLFLDADERVTPALAEEVKTAALEGQYDGYYIPRKNIIFGQEMCFGGHQGDRHLRFFKKAKTSFQGPIHERAVVDGRVGFLEEALIHYSTGTMGEYMKKFKLYTDLEAEYLYEGKSPVRVADIIVKPPGRFFKQYILQKGFLDGFKGLTFYGLSSAYLFVKYLKYWKLENKRRRQ